MVMPGDVKMPLSPLWGFFGLSRLPKNKNADLFPLRERISGFVFITVHTESSPAVRWSRT